MRSVKAVFQSKVELLGVFGFEITVSHLGVVEVVEGGRTEYLLGKPED